MAVRHIEGFRKYESSGNMTTRLARVYQNVTAGTSIDYRVGRYATSGGFTMNSVGDFCEFSIAPSTAGVGSFIHGFNIKRNGSTTNVLQYLTNRSGGLTFGLNFTPGAHKIHNANKGNIGIDDGNWHHIEFIQYPSGGTDALYVDGLLVATQASNALGVLAWYQGENTDAFSHGYQISDWYVLDNLGSSNNARLGPDTRVETLLPNGDDATQQWTVIGEASAYLVLDNVPEQSGKYLASNADNQVGQVTWGNLTNITEVAAVQLAALAQNQDSLNLKDLRFVQAGTEIGTQWEPALTLGLRQEIFNTNPVAAAAWTSTTVNGLVAGLKSKP